ncbi:hypothetical protein M8998_00840 [Sphingobacterium sp. lm-10]|uniref:hypothetical protein n=1 Tax=Sphingobacterium sp. lm-10 TaxID=2944904 RepID=UPI00202150AA|nr:hypothetical protein [Sphingobacterium sp. lm-10]MCL7986475.1 hypothetical protein [Sphingobacterium sp. lm-10]
MRSNKKSYSAGRIILFVLVLSVAIGLIIQQPAMILLQEHGFNPAFHGTISSWMIYLVLLVTAIYGYKILQSQLTVQREQTSLSKLYAYHIRSQHHADISFVAESLPAQEESRYFLKPSFKITKKNAWNLRVESDLNHSLSQPYSIKRTPGGYTSAAANLEEGSMLTVTVSENILDSLSDTIPSKQEPLQEAELPIIASYKIKFWYQDEFGLNYSKTFILSYSQQDQKLQCISSNVDYL